MIKLDPCLFQNSIFKQFALPCQQNN